MSGGDPEYALTYEQAAALLPDGGTVHALVNPAVNFLVGADWPRAEVLALLRSGRPERAGPEAEASGHGLVAFIGDDPVFFATRGGPDGD